MTVDVGEDKAERRRIPLGTADKRRAARMLAKLVREIEAGRIVADAKDQATQAETLIESIRAWCKDREARGVAMARTELGYAEHHIAPHKDIAYAPVVDVRRPQCTMILERASMAMGAKTGKRLSKGTVSHLRRMLVRFFNSLEAKEVILSNPMRLVAMPSMKEDKRKRTPVVDHEYEQLLRAPVTFEPTKKTAAPSISEIEFFEMKVVAFTARTLGGARAAECLRWDWSMIDREGFLSCVLGRAKGGDVQALEFPEVLQQFIRGWWLASGRPASGPVFPVSRGARKGQARGKSALAARLRRALIRAGVTRHELHHDVAFEADRLPHAPPRLRVRARAVGSERTDLDGARAPSRQRRASRVQPGADQSRSRGRVASVQTRLRGSNRQRSGRFVFRHITIQPKYRAGYRVRTGDIQLGKLALYQLS